MTRWQIAVVCYVAGLTVVGANLAVDLVGRRLYTCDPDPYSREPCAAQQWIPLGMIVACWLIATYVIARREAIGPFACASMGLMLWLGIGASGVLIHNYLRDDPWREDWLSWDIVLIDVFVAAPVIGLLTAGVGHAMQVSIQARRRKRLSRAPA